MTLNELKAISEALEQTKKNIENSFTEHDEFMKSIFTKSGEFTMYTKYPDAFLSEKEQELYENNQY